MKILYRQSDDKSGSLGRFGVSDCYYKQLLVEWDRNSITKTHHHTGFELHIMTCGYQDYEVGDRQLHLAEGTLLLIPPKLPHRVICSGKNTEKTSITFSLAPDPRVEYLYLATPGSISENLAFITREAASGRSSSRLLVENRVLEIILLTLRLAGMAEDPAPACAGENAALTLSKQYIADNIERNPTVSEVAQYCYISTKQLTRIFAQHEGISPGGYIIQQRAQQVARLLSQGELSLQQISSRMHFSSEYYFNVFFKKYVGMPPGEYRKMHGNL